MAWNRFGGPTSWHIPTAAPDRGGTRLQTRHPGPTGAALDLTAAVAELARRGVLSPAEHELHRAVMEWFEEHLPTPAPPIDELADGAPSWWFAEPIDVRVDAQLSRLLII